ncbi:NADH dehydrogenase [Clostridium carboxidivorans P7]|uniref:Respiratory-chain NADH dehydrogenase domain 51 kDa subunit n=1 Tax=Clostridium carboxidivorans P7 TaxID=536227 RepID=C6PQJ3_9CLOT|nr:4Fe-4S dicluster domain-containing protein [Clostridium carboxidivorans]AKN30416.1 NADH dehydrogenase [Clostridium carboxidivorans P7]EET88515.1 Respiratory-chain NADH dehydrogenase domain 51 kDa subunit [Clostridium carboxidivorans P7]EFG86155.1 respiratory-chain NADH dehydrogenase 51 Kd subunit [Clostridium carboxidivorans P7]
MDLLEKIQQAGIIGAGGAGFPTHIKLNCKVEYFIVNGLECEPLLQSDKYMMRNKSDEIVQAVEEIGKAIGAKHLVIGLKEEYRDEIQALKNSIEKFNSKIKLHLSRAFYPAGDEQVLVYEVTGRTIPPAGIPLNVGAVVSNSGTILNIFEAMQDKAVTYKFVTVIGEVAKPSIVKVPIGTKVKEVLEKCGGVLTKDYAIIMGGPMMGKRMSKDQIEGRVITKTDGAIIVLPEDHYLAQRERMTIEHIKNQAKSACIQCHFCTDMCPRNLIGHPINPHKIMRSIALKEQNEEVLKQAMICCECGVCEMYACPMRLSPKRINVYVKGMLRESGVKWQNTTNTFTPNILRDYRKVPTGRLIARLQLDKYRKQRLQEGEGINPAEVKIPLRQGIGAGTIPVVNVGDTVEKGQLIGKVEEGKMGANVHASINGTISEISDSIAIKAI